METNETRLLRHAAVGREGKYQGRSVRLRDGATIEHMCKGSGAPSAGHMLHVHGCCKKAEAR